MKFIFSYILILTFFSPLYSQSCFIYTIGRGKTHIVYMHDNSGDMLMDSIYTSSDSTACKDGISEIEKNNTFQTNISDSKNSKLNLANLYREMNRVGLSNKLYVLAQAVHETAFFTSNVCRKYNNLFGLYNSRTKDYFRFDRWEDSVVAYKKYIQYRYKGGEYRTFLKNIGYAEDPKYIQKVDRILDLIVKHLNK